MGARFIQVADGFWNIRGSFKIGGVVDIGTHASLVRRTNGKFVLLDACPLGGSLERDVSALTNAGKDLEAVLHLHPFHTVHVRAMHDRYPNAKLYGTSRHLAKYPELPWQTARTEDSDLHSEFAEDFDFSVPAGVDFVSSNENVHFSSVLALHRATLTIHVDDTLMYMRLPRAMRRIGLGDSLTFHPTLSSALEKRAGAAGEFRTWARSLAEDWREAKHLCAAHTSILTAEKNAGASIAARVLAALDKVSGKLNAHHKKYG